MKKIYRQEVYNGVSFIQIQQKLASQSLFENKPDRGHGTTRARHDRLKG